MANVEVKGETLTREEWMELSRKLRDPFDPSDVDFRVQGSGSGTKTQVVAYVDARTVQDRLDAVVGPGNWSFDWEPVVTDKGEVMVAKGKLTIFGVTMSDAGAASNFDASKGAVSDALKRAAVHFGVGRYLYSLPVSLAASDRGRILPAALKELRDGLPKPGMTPKIAPIEQRWSEEERATQAEVQPAQALAQQATQEATTQQENPAAPQRAAAPSSTPAAVAAASNAVADRMRKEMTEIRFRYPEFLPWCVANKDTLSHLNTEENKKKQFVEYASVDNMKEVKYKLDTWLGQWKTSLEERGTSFEQVFRETKEKIAKTGTTYEALAARYGVTLEPTPVAASSPAPVALIPPMVLVQDAPGESLEDEPVRESDESLGLAPDNTPIQREGDPDSPTQAQFAAFDTLLRELGGTTPEINSRLKSEVGNWGVMEVRRQYLPPELQGEGVLEEAIKAGTAKTGPRKCWTRAQLGKATGILRKMIAERESAAPALAA